MRLTAVVYNSNSLTKFQGSYLASLAASRKGVPEKAQQERRKETAGRVVTPIVCHWTYTGGCKATGKWLYPKVGHQI